jgi:hypothetical protein
MSSVITSAARVKPDRKPLQSVCVVGRWVGGCTPHDLLVGAAILEIEDAKELTSYWCELHVNAGLVTGYRLRKFVTGEKYDLPRDLSSCDCPDGIYRAGRPGGCRHAAALRQALPLVTARPVDRKTERDELSAPDAA